MGRRILAALLLAALGLAAGCTSGSDYRIGIDSPALYAGGEYVSGDTGGSLGHLTLTLVLREGAQRTYDANLTSQDKPDFGESVGVGTVGNEHIILNFDRGKDTDYYFEGQLVLTGVSVTGISGQFVFPDLEETLPAEFTIL